MPAAEKQVRCRVDEHKMAITKLIYKRIDVDRDGDDLMIVMALAELTATFGARLIGREQTSQMLSALSQQVLETELVWPSR